MKAIKILFFSILLFILIAVSFFAVMGNFSTPPEGKDFSIMSFNIRFNSVLDFGLDNWYFRRPFVAEFLIEKGCDIVCMQEVTRQQYNDITADLGSEYEIYWWKRDQDRRAEGLAILLKKGVFEVLDEGVFWLSDTPEVMSKSWCETYRICVFLELKFLEGDLPPFCVYNVHLDHKVAEAQTKGIELVDEVATARGCHAIICGDFNCDEGGNPSDAFIDAHEKYLDCRLDSRRSLGRRNTYNGFGSVEYNPASTPIDHIMTDTYFYPDTFTLCLDRPNNGGYYSDHYAIIAEIIAPYGV